MDGALNKMALPVWLTPKRITAVSLMLSTSIAAGIAIANVTETAEPYWLSTRGFVRDEIKMKVVSDIRSTVTRQISTQIKIDKLEKRLIEDKIADKELLLQQQINPPPQFRAAVQEQIRGYNDALKEIVKSISKLEIEHDAKVPREQEP